MLSHCRRILTALMLVAILATGARAQSPSEEEVKAAFLYNFTQFVIWPDSAFETIDSPLVIGIYGVNPFGSFLEDLVRDEQVSLHPLQVRYVDTKEEIEQCHILYVDDRNRNRVNNALELCEQKSILTVSDSNQFIELGGMIRFVKLDNKLRFQIHAQRAEYAGIRISSKVLRLADVEDNTDDAR